jgi:hypothetical protein
MEAQMVVAVTAGSGVEGYLIPFFTGLTFVDSLSQILNSYICVRNVPCHSKLIHALPHVHFSSDMSSFSTKKYPPGQVFFKLENFGAEILKNLNSVKNTFTKRLTLNFTAPPPPHLNFKELLAEKKVVTGAMKSVINSMLE